jgi:hypothetical protein
MPSGQPEPITADEHRRRRRRVEKIARSLGFVGRVEYRHVISGSGGAQIKFGKSIDEDLLIVDVQAFQRDANPEDFTLEAMIAHERGHQIIVRVPIFQRLFAKGISPVAEEVLASLMGSIIAADEHDRVSLRAKADFDAVRHGMKPDRAVVVLDQMRSIMESLYDRNDDGN